MVSTINVYEGLPRSGKTLMQTVDGFVVWCASILGYMTTELKDMLIKETSITVDQLYREVNEVKRKGSYKMIPILADYEVAFDHRFFDYNLGIDQLPVGGCLCLLDELYINILNRQWKGQKNIDLTQAFPQFQKRGASVVCNSHRLGKLDINFRTLVIYCTKCSVFPEPPELPDSSWQPEYFSYTRGEVINEDTMRVLDKYMILEEDCRQFYKLFKSYAPYGSYKGEGAIK